MPSGAIITAPDLDPTCSEPFKPHFEDELVSASTVRGKLMLPDCMLATVLVVVLLVQSSVVRGGKALGDDPPEIFWRLNVISKGA